jgi:hypothetical protein
MGWWVGGGVAQEGRDEVCKVCKVKYENAEAKSVR